MGGHYNSDAPINPGPTECLTDAMVMVWTFSLQQVQDGDVLKNTCFAQKITIPQKVHDLAISFGFLVMLVEQEEEDDEQNSLS